MNIDTWLDIRLENTEAFSLLTAWTGVETFSKLSRGGTFQQNTKTFQNSQDTQLTFHSASGFEGHVINVQMMMEIGFFLRIE